MNNIKKISAGVLCLTMFALPVSAQTFDVRLYDDFAGEAQSFADPAVETATLEWLDILSRVIHAEKPIRLNLTDVAFTDGTLGTAGVSRESGSTAAFCPNDFSRLAEEGLDDNFAQPYPLLRVLGARDSQQGNGPSGSTSLTCVSRDGSIRLSSVHAWDTTIDITATSPTDLYSVITHELIHMLGFSSSLSVDVDAGTEGFWGPDNTTLPSSYDALITVDGVALTSIADAAERYEAVSTQELLFAGETARLYAADILSAGANANGVELQVGSFPNLSHLSTRVSPNVLLSPNLTPDEEFFVSFAAISDLGYGDMLDTQVTTASVSDGELVLSVQSETLQPRASIDKVFLTLEKPTGITISSNTLSCVDAALSLTCELPSFSTNTPLNYSFVVGGTADGLFTARADVEHRDLHVDANPLNNFYDVSLQVGQNPLSAVGFDVNGAVANVLSVDEGATAIASLLADNSDASQAVTFTLADGAGDDDNDLFTLSGSALTVGSALDHETKASYSLRVLATAANGFTAEQALTLNVTDTRDDNCFNSSVVGYTPLPLVNSAYAATGGALSLGLVQMLLAFLGMGANSLVHRSKRLGRASKVLLMIGLTAVLVGCGGGGSDGGSSVASC